MRASLTSYGRRLVEDHLELAVKSTAAFLARKRIVRDDMVSLAYRAAIEAALTYRPCCGTSFKTWLACKAPLFVIDQLREENGRKGQRAKRPKTVLLGAFAFDPREHDESGGAEDDMLQLAADEDPVGWALEYEDEIRRLSRCAAPAAARVFRMTNLNAAHAAQVATGRALGMSESRIAQLVKEGRGEVQRHLGVSSSVA